MKPQVFVPLTAVKQRVILFQIIDISIPFKEIEEITGFNDKNVIEEVWHSVTKQTKDRDEIMNAVISHFLDNASTTHEKTNPKVVI